MAEGWINQTLGARWSARSAGTSPAERVAPLAIDAMSEVGIDISKAVPESVEGYLDASWDLVVTVCDAARESCPVFPSPVESFHISFPDPAEATGTDEERMAVFRAVRDSIRERLLPELERRAGVAGGGIDPTFVSPAPR
jgi:arsenate reductase